MWRVGVADSLWKIKLADRKETINHEHRVRIAQMLDHIGAHIFPDSLRIPHGTPQHMLHTIGRRIAVDFRQLPAVFPHSITFSGNALSPS